MKDIIRRTRLSDNERTVVSLVRRSGTRGTTYLNLAARLSHAQNGSVVRVSDIRVYIRRILHKTASDPVLTVVSAPDQRRPHRYGNNTPVRIFPEQRERKKRPT